MLFVSKSRGESNEFSDTDLLVITNKKRNISDRLILSDITTDINIDYGTDLSCIYISQDEWLNDQVNPLLKQEIIKEGIEVVF